MKATPSTQRTALVIGAAGNIGGAVTRALLSCGWRVKALVRRPRADSSGHTDLTWIVGDAMNGQEVLRAAAGAHLIVHAANPPGYRHWGRLVLPMMDNTIAAAKAVGARILLPGNVYNYGAEAGPIVTETSPQHPCSRKGAIRVELEERLRRSGAKTLIVRAGDYFGPGVGKSSWFSQLITPGRKVSHVFNPGDRGVGHGWAYLPDLADTMAALAERDGELEDFAAFNFQGHWLEAGEEMAAAILRVAERPAAPPRAFPWFMVTALRPVVPIFSEVSEMRYLWRRPLRLDNAKLRDVLGREPHTPLDRAVACTLESLGCLEADWPLAALPRLA